MPALRIEPTRSTPRITFDEDNSRLTIEGESYPEDAARFYQPVFDWLRTYLSEETKALEVDLRIGYLNTSSTKCMMTLLDRLEEAHTRGVRVTVTWRYAAGNEMAEECGKELGEDLKLPFAIVQEGV